MSPTPEEDKGVDNNNVQIGDIENGIHDSTIAGGDVNQTFVNHPVGSVTQSFSTTIQIGSLKLSKWGVAILFISLLLVAALPILYQLPIGSTPLPTPPPLSMVTRVPMTTTFNTYNVAIAEFGQLDAQGNVRQSKEAKELSQFLAQKLTVDFAAPDADPQHNSTIQFKIRQDMLNLPPGSRPIGVITNPIQAEQIRSELEADLLIYGHLTADQPAKLALDFVYAAKQLAIDPDAKSYQHLGTPIVLENVGQNQAKDVFNNNPSLTMREKAIIWLAHGLAQELAGGPEAYKNALDTFQQAEKSLTAWAPQDGKEVLYYFQGREALALQSLSIAESAFSTATQINPDYAIAYIGQGKVHLQRVQRYFLGAQKSTEDIAACRTAGFSASQIPNIATEPITITGAMTNINVAITNFQIALTKTQNITDPLIPAVATAMLGTAHRFQGLVYTRVQQLDKANAALNQATTEFTATVPAFTATKQFGFLAYTYYLLGETSRQQAYLAIQQQDNTKAIAHYHLAHKNYEQCYKLEPTPNPGGDTRLQKTIGCLCGYWDYHVRMDLSNLGGGKG